MITYHARVFCSVILLCMLSPIHDAWAGAPTDQLRGGIDRVFKILRDPETEVAGGQNGADGHLIGGGEDRRGAF